VFDHFKYAAGGADKESSHADILKALAFSFKLVNTTPTTIRSRRAGSSRNLKECSKSGGQHAGALLVTRRRHS
jgi:hypothetical protein